MHKSQGLGWAFTSLSCYSLLVKTIRGVYNGGINFISKKPYLKQNLRNRRLFDEKLLSRNHGRNSCVELQQRTAIYLQLYTRVNKIRHMYRFVQ